MINLLDSDNGKRLCFVFRDARTVGWIVPRSVTGVARTDSAKYIASYLRVPASSISPRRARGRSWLFLALARDLHVCRRIRLATFGNPVPAQGTSALLES